MVKFKNLKISGFKSFIDPVELPIEDGLTGIVGPNGCGKSNLVEALRWVMGESSAKNVRGQEMDDVIFSGTDDRSSRNLAEVTLTTPLKYLSLVFAIIFGFYFFEEIPTINTLLGAGLIVVSSAIIFFRASQLKKPIILPRQQ